MKQITDEQVANEANIYQVDEYDCGNVGDLARAFKEGAEWMKQQLEDINVPQSAEVMTLEECLDQWDGLPLGKDEGYWYSRKVVLRAMAEYASQFKAKSEALQAELDKRHWIPISDITESNVLIVAYTGGGVKTLTYIEGRFWVGDGTEWMSTVTHFMPSPSAPKEGVKP